jgi:hypothetical protein
VPNICVHKAERTTVSRGNIVQALKCELLLLRFAQHAVQISESALSSMPLTYVGHSPVRHITVHNSYVYIDQGVSMRSSRPMVPTVLEHMAFAHWLNGAATGRAEADVPA